MEVWSTSGQRLLETGTLEPQDLDPPRETNPDRQARTRTLAGGPVRTMTETLRLPHGRFVLRAVVSEAGARAEVRRVWLELLALSAGVLVLGGLGGALLARRSLKPLARMARHARRITVEHLGERLPPQDTAELEQIRVAFNETLEQLEGSFDQLRRFTADASHELRTPLTALRSVGEVGLQSATTTQEARDVIGSMLEEVDRLARLAEELLTLARAEAGEAKLHLEPVDLSQLAHDVVAHLCVLAEERQQFLEAEPKEPVMARGDRIALRQAVVNLVDNAIKYSPDSTFITLATGHRGQTRVHRGARRGTGPQRRGPAAGLRAVLPRRQEPLTAHGGNRTGTLPRRVDRPGPRRLRRARHRTRPRQHLPPRPSGGRGRFLSSRQPASPVRSDPTRGEGDEQQEDAGEGVTGMAEREGFEPSVEGLPLHVISSHADSATLASLRPLPPGQSDVRQHGGEGGIRTHGTL